VFPALVPGVSCYIINRSTPREVGPQVRKESTVKPGEKADLADILIEDPSSSN
jgi:hypothetical protein